ncbi:hybrid sensor histidine kinase/response regulator [Azohydromonas aeria]|uniref:hybrid sensor histidine kinase/response regulator n=1 Tax=Azohydromonas aeria TaxID=2590212 RepID=UPI0012F7BA3A|nr:PAS domain-containing protein [Azohydromonas aeria]
MDRPARRLKPLPRKAPRGRAGTGRLQSCAARREPVSGAAQRRQHELLRHAPGFVAVLRGPRHVLEFANESLLQLFLRDERIVGMTLREAFPELQGQGWFELLDAVYRQGERRIARGMPLALSAAPGAPVLELRLDLACEPIRDAAGAVTGVFCTGQDVTEILAAQQVLVHAEEQLRLATDAAEVGFWDVDPDSGVVQWPARVKAMFGLAEDAPVTMDDFFAGLHPDDRERVRDAFAAACDPARRAPYDVEYRTIGRLDGVLRWVAAKGRALFSADGRCTRVLGTALDITARKAAQEALRRMDERSALLQAISDVSPDAIFAKDRAGRLLFANPATLALVGKPADRVIGHTDAEFLDDAAAARLVMDNDRHVMEGARAQEIEEPLPHPDGSLRVWLSRKMPLRDAAGAVVGLLGVSRDITERKRLERELQDSKDALQRILDSITDGLAVLDAQWRYTYFNQQGARMLGLRSEDLIGRCLWELFPHAEATLFGREYRRAMDTGKPTHFEEFYPAPLERWLECHCYPSADGLSVFFRGVTDRHRAEAARQASEQRLRRVFELNPIGLVTGDATGRIHEANDAFLRLVGMTREDLRQGRVRWDALTPPEHLEADWRALAQVRRDGISAIYEKEYLRPGDGRRVPVMLATCLFDSESPGEDAGSEALLAFVIDISARKQAEEALRQSDRRKDEFLATLAHELRNPLAPLRNAAQLLAAPALRADQLRWVQRLIERQVGHMARLLDDLLDLARISQGKLHLKKERVTLAAIVEPAVEAVRPLIEGKRHALTLALEAAQPEALVLEADAVRLAQVLSNLLANAAKYTDAGGHLLLSARREADALVLEVSDDGIGLPVEARSRIFEMFGQLESGAGRSEGGLGIGLALVAGIVELHGGQVGVDSAGPGQGSRFTVRLPLQALPDAPAPAPAVAQPRPGLRVLVADDNEDAAQTLALLLSFQGCETRVALSGAAAVETALRWPPDAAVLDIGMPGLDGHAVAQALRAQPDGARLLLVALTGWGQDADRRKSAAAGFDHHLTKPVDVPRLLALLAALRGE